MAAELIYRRREARRTLQDREIRIVMDLYRIPEPDRIHYPEGYRFSWIAFDVEDPSLRVLFDCHPPKGPHIHIDGDADVYFEWISLEKTEEIFSEKYRALLVLLSRKMRRCEFMKVFTFRYQKGIRQKVLHEMKEAMRTGQTAIHDDEMLCDSVESLLKCITKSRMEAFLAIIEHKPESVYELAQVLGKDQANVLKDAKALESMGLIELAPVKDGHRERFKPKALFDMIAVEMGLQSLVQSPPKKKAG